ncbi:MAG: L-aspartate oxidase [Candidatus Dadabacteria bacterium]|nr:L-aspartate oxidase [Candidatus Dadabacteria bacterium]NIQ15224.1 L-aspartate oxidase [Candidatus Dadabacteria bacterium]
MKKTVDIFDCDFLIIGSGLAGLYSALYASKYGKCIVVTKQTLNQSNSFWAQGGIAAAIDPEDSPVFHKEDTINAGRGLCNIKAVEILVKEGKERVIDLINLGMKFDSDSEGLLLGLEGGHSKRRVLHAGGNSTGREMVEFLISAVSKNPSIQILELTTITDLVSDGSSCFGAWGFNQNNNNYIRVNSRSTILATGGASALYKRTTNPEGATGEGISLAYRAGAEISDMEFIQFHPTAFYVDQGESFLITEAVRGEGAHLINTDGKRFMKNYHPREELAPRDVVSKAIYNEIKRSGKDYVYLSLSHLNRKFIRDRFSNIYSHCLKYNYDLTRDLIPVAPAAHYTIGGVRTGLMGNTNIKGLYTCGEVSNTGVHGANRLASNSLLECIVFAKRAVDGALDNFINDKFKAEFNGFPIAETDSNDQVKYNLLKEEILNSTTYNLGIIRDGKLINKFISRLNELEIDCDKLSGWFRFKISSMIDVCTLMSLASLNRKESRGAHVREDFSEEDENLVVSYIYKINSEPYEVGIN